MNQEYQKMMGIQLSSEPFRSMRKKELESEGKKVTDGMEKLLDGAESEQRDINTEEEKAFNAAKKYLQDLRDEADRRPANQPPRIAGTFSGDGATSGAATAFGKVGASFDELFVRSGMIKYQNDMPVEEFCNAVTSKSYESRVMSSLSGAAGGFAIPVAWERQIYNSVQAESFALSRCRLYPMTTSTLVLPAWDSEDQTQGHWAGIEVQRLPETGTATPRTPKMREMTLSSISDVLYVDVSRQAIMDAPDLSNSLGSGMIYALGQNFDDEVLTGAGVGGPLGVINSSGAVFVARATAGAISYADIVALRSRIHPNFAKSAVWVASTDVLETLLLLEDAAGSYVFPNSFRGVDAAIPDQMLGRPIFWTDKMAILGGSGDLALIDFSAVALGLRQGIFLENSSSPQWYQNLVSYRAITMWDAQPLLQKPITPRNGSTNTLSFAAVLE